MLTPIKGAPASKLPKLGAAQFSFQPLPTVSQIMAMLDGIGAATVRFEVPWADTELQRGVYVVPPYVEGFIAASRAAGLTTVLVLAYGNRLYPGSGDWNLPPRDAESCAAFASYGAWLVGQYAADDVLFEIYNEPNNPTFWAGAPNPSEYANLLAACLSAMRAVPGKTPKIITAGIGSVFSQGDCNAFMNAVLKAQDVSSVSSHTLHPYHANEPPEALFAFVDAYRAEVPWDGTLGVTEWGYSSDWIEGDEKTRSIYVARLALCAILAGLELCNIYSLHDTGDDLAEHEYNFGLHKFDKATPKPAAAAFRAVMGALAGTVSYDAEQVGAVYRITLRKDDGTVTKIVWTDAEGQMNHIEPMATVANVVDVTGYQTWFRFLPPGQIAMTLGATIPPILINGTT